MSLPFRRSSGADEMRNLFLLPVLALVAAATSLPGTLATAQHGSTATKSSPATLTASEAHVKAMAGEVVLIDIRTPEEWKETGIPASAHAINMYDEPKAFTQRLMAAVGGDRARRIALICRTGNRSSTLQAQLVRAGFTNVVDVSEGVAGGRYGKGWLKLGLPTRPGSMASVPPEIPAKAATK